MKRPLFLILIVIVGLAAWFSRGQVRDWYAVATKPELPEAQPAVESPASNPNGDDDAGNTNVTETNSAAEQEPVDENTPDPAGNIAPVNTNRPAPLPVEVNLAVPFTSQAPHANWDLPYQEACEEAAALMVHRFWQNKPLASKDDADRAIREIVDFQEEEYGFYKDTTVEETARFIRDLWGYDDVEVVTGSAVTADRIKREVADGFPVIALAAGRQLGNPNFTQPGPIYHALVVKGFTKGGKFITNDPGTRKGADYLYDPKVLISAIHDWNDGDVANGQKAIVIVRGR
ncbi:MAG: C39 family peptidase [Candidatus Kerfeldbacteria bacterium]|nr:C39 family peptidase [Candidatus Kerfeldbacteria bacterium]